MISTVYSALSFTLFTISDDSVCLCVHALCITGFLCHSYMMVITHSDCLQKHMDDVLWLSNCQNCTTSFLFLF